MKRIILVVLAGGLALASLSCGFIDRRVSQASALANNTAPVTGEDAFPAGYYRQTSMGDSHPLVRVYFHEGELLLFSEAGDPDSGTYLVSGSQLLVDTASCSAGRHGSSAYNWEYDGGVLRLFASGADECTLRSDLLEGEYRAVALP